MAVSCTSTSLSPQAGQVVNLAAGAVRRSACELYAHSAAARSVGPLDQVIWALAVGQLLSLIGAYRTV